MTERKSKVLFWVFKIAGILVSCALPIWAICEKFPIWAEDHGTGHSIGVGAILIAIVLLIIFRKTVFDFIKDHFDLKHAPPLAIWIVMLVISYILVYLGEVMRDMTTVFWMGFIGCTIGTFLTYLSNRFRGDVTKNE
jgi:hypothetical protein